MLVDTGADVTVIAIKDWPKDWTLESSVKGLVGIGESLQAYQSKYMLTIKT